MARTVGQTGEGVEEFGDIVGNDVVLAECVSIHMSCRGV